MPKGVLTDEIEAQLAKEGAIRGQLVAEGKEMVQIEAQLAKEGAIRRQFVGEGKEIPYASRATRLSNSASSPTRACS